MSYPVSKKNEFIELRAEGHSYLSIAKKLKVSKSTLFEWGKEFKDQIQEKEFEIIEEIQESYKQTKKARIETLIKRLQKMENKFDESDFKDIPAVDLLKMIQTTKQELEKELKTVMRVEEENAETEWEMTETVFETLK
jgi:predicted RND superfamily exporter protein